MELLLHRTLQPYSPTESLEDTAAVAAPGLFLDWPGQEMSVCWLRQGRHCGVSMTADRGQRSKYWRTSASSQPSASHLWLADTAAPASPQSIHGRDQARLRAPPSVAYVCPSLYLLPQILIINLHTPSDHTDLPDILPFLNVFASRNEITNYCKQRYLFKNKKGRVFLSKEYYINLV